MRSQAHGAVLALALAVACGGARPAPRDPGPEASDLRASAAELAAELDRQLADLAAIVHAHRSDCRRLAAELRAVFARMERSIRRAREAQEDPDHARALTSALRAYDEISAERTAAIEADFAADPSCISDPEVREVLGSMPIL